MFRIKIILVSILICFAFTFENSFGQEGKIFLTPRIGINNFYGNLGEKFDFGWNLGFTCGYFPVDNIEIEAGFGYNPFPPYVFVQIIEGTGYNVERSMADLGFDLGLNYYLYDPTLSTTPYIGLKAGYNNVSESIDSRTEERNFASAKNNMLSLTPQIGLAILLRNGGSINIRVKYMIPLNNSDPDEKFDEKYLQYYGGDYKYWSVNFGYSFKLN